MSCRKEALRLLESQRLALGGLLGEVFLMGVVNEKDDDSEDSDDDFQYSGWDPPAPTPAAAGKDPGSPTETKRLPRIASGREAGSDDEDEDSDDLADAR